MISVIIADDHAVVRTGLAALLETEGDIEVVGLAQDGIEAVDIAARLRPDIAIIDLQMPRMNGVAATAEIAKVSPRTRVMALTTFSSSDDISAALEAGAVGAFMKTATETELIAAVRDVAAGRRRIQQDVSRLLKSDPPAPPLTDRQLFILEMMTAGFTNQDIARQIGITTSGVNQHILTILDKLGAANRTEAAAIAVRKGLVKAQPSA